MTRRFWKSAAVIGLLLLAIAGAVLCWVYQAAQAVPEFYQHALDETPELAIEEGEKFERQVLELRNEARQDGRWQVIFSEAQINGWLATELPTKFPKLLPPEVEMPRVAIVSERLMFGCRYRRDSLTTVFSLELEPYLTDQTNELAIRVRAARAGSLPVPLSELIAQATRAAQKNQVLLRWQTADGDPVALLSMAEKDVDAVEPRVVIERIELRTGELIVTGRTKVEAETPERPVPTE